MRLSSHFPNEQKIGLSTAPESGRNYSSVERSGADWTGLRDSGKQGTDCTKIRVDRSLGAGL